MSGSLATEPIPRAVVDELLGLLSRLFLGTWRSVAVWQRRVAVPVPAVTGILSALGHLRQDLQKLRAAVRDAEDGYELAFPLRSAATWLQDYSSQARRIHDLFEEHELRARR